jgi:PAS domain S-box-containing protein
MQSKPAAVQPDLPGAGVSPELRPALIAELATLGALARATGSARTSVEIAKAAVEILCRATGAPAALVLFNDGDDYEVGAHRGVSDETISLVEGFHRVGARLTGALEASEQPLAGPVSAAPLRAEIVAAIEADGIHHVMLVGLRAAGTLIGVLGLGWPERPVNRPMDPVMTQAATMIGVGLENARLVERLERALDSERRLAEELAALQSLTLIAERAQVVSELAETTVRQVAGVVDAAGAAYGLVTGGQIEYHAEIGVPDDVLEAVTGPRGADMLRRVADRGAFFESYVPGSQDVSDWTLSVAAREGWASYAIVPIRIETRLEALLVLYFARPVAALEFGPRELDRIGAIASISLANFRLRERLQASESRYRSLFEASPAPVVVLSSDQQVVAANRTALELYRTDLERLREFVRENGGLLHGAGREERERLMARDGRATFRDVGHRPDGGTFPVQVDVARVDLAGEEQSLVIVRDLTEQERLQHERQQAQKMEALGQLVSGLAHELNNPLASIIAFSQLIRGDARLPEDLRNDAELLTREADRTRQITKNLLDFARRRPPERVSTSVRALVQSVLDLQSYGLTSGRIAVDVDIPRDLPTIDVDRGQIQQVLLNLTLNAMQAIRAARPEGTITITARETTADPDSPMVRLSVADNGVGVPPDDRARLFVPFFTTREPGEGTGLGLPVSFGIVDAHGGRLWYEPRHDGVGATFTLELPVRAGAVPEVPPLPGPAGAPTERALPATEPTPTGSAASTATADVAERRSGGSRLPVAQAREDGTMPTVLVLDDEPAIRAFLAKALRLGRFDATVAQRGTEAVDLVRERPFDAVLVDHRMPGMSGTSVYEAVVALRPELATRFVFMSGDVLNPELKRFADERSVALLGKPFDVETVLRVVGDVVGQRASRG